MFGMGFTEILVIAVIAILFLGPDKLPSTMVEIAKFFKSVKQTIGSVKESIEEEMHVADIKKEALAYKQELAKASTEVAKLADVNTHVNSLLDEGDAPTQEATPPKPSSDAPQEVTFKKKKKKKKKEDIDV